MVKHNKLAIPIFSTEKENELKLFLDECLFGPTPLVGTK